MIQEYLNMQFIQTTEDANFEKLKKTCAEVVKKISKDKAKIYSFSLVALDPEVPADNPDLLEVKQIIIDNWNTFMANSKDTPVTIIRAVMLEALQIISKEISSACLIWYAGRNVFKYYKLGREKDILKKFLTELGNKVEQDVSESWSFSPDMEIVVPEITSAIIDKTELEGHLKTAALQTTVGGENPYWPSQNDANWSTFFATRASKGIAETITKTFKKQASELISHQTEFIHQNILMQMRTKLLWWKEACYSTSFKGSYKELKDGELQIVIAIDYSSFVPVMYPTCVDYFLKETHNSLSSSGDKKNKISEILKLIEQGNTILKDIISEYSGGEGRISFINFIKGLVHGKFQAKQFKSLVGVADSTELTFAEFTLWIFHDLHSLKLSSIK